MTTAGPTPPAALDHLTVLADLQAQFLATIPLVDPSTPVTSCGDWTVRDLVLHLGEVHHWAAAQARRVPTTPLATSSDLATFYATSADELLATLRTLDPYAPAWLLDDEPGPVRFWHRRQLHETLIHLWDLRTAAGLPLDVAPAIWADAVDEVVTVMQPRQERLGRMESLTCAVALEAKVADRAWQLGAGEPAVVVLGTADALALLLWGRKYADDSALSILGDRPALDAALAASLAP